MNIVSAHNATAMENHNDKLCLLYDCQFTGVEDKFVNSILHGNQKKCSLNVQDSCQVCFHSV